MTIGNIGATIVGIALVLGGILYFGGYLTVDDGGINLDKEALSSDAGDATAVDPYTKAGNIYSSLQYDKALPAYQDALKDDSDHKEAPLARFRIARCYQKLNKPAKAKAAYQEFVKLHPGDRNASQARKFISVL